VNLKDLTFEMVYSDKEKILVGLAGFEPAISWVRGHRVMAPKPRGQSGLFISLLDLASRQPLEGRSGPVSL